MSSLVHLSLACGDYDLNRGLIDGTVRPQGVDLTVLTAPSPERHWRMGHHLEFDACEFSLATYLMLHARAADPFVAIPVFPHRRFRHSFIFVNAAAGVREPKDLEGRRVGLRAWQTTAGLWCRGILQDDYGVDLGSIRWVTQDEEDVAFDAPPGLLLERVPDGDTVTARLIRGELDALIYPEVPASIRAGDPRVTRLFNDAKAREIDWFRRTGLFPIMHTVILQRRVVEEHPWVAVSLLDAFRASKDRAFARLEDPRATSLAWVSDLLDEQRTVLGHDPWCFAFGPNRENLATAIRWAHEQGLIDHPFPPEDLFVPSTLDVLPTYV